MIYILIEQGYTHHTNTQMSKIEQKEQRMNMKDKFVKPRTVYIECAEMKQLFVYACCEKK